MKAEPVEDVIPPENVAEQSTTDTSQPTVSAQDEMLVDHLSTPELNHPVPVQSVKIETPSMPSAAVDLVGFFRVNRTLLTIFSVQLKLQNFMYLDQKYVST